MWFRPTRNGLLKSCLLNIVDTTTSHQDTMTSSNGNIFRVTGLCVGNSPVPGEFPAQRPVTRSFDVFFDLQMNKRLIKQSWGWWFETPPWSLWRQCNEPPSEQFCGDIPQCFALICDLTYNNEVGFGLPVSGLTEVPAPIFKLHIFYCKQRAIDYGVLLWVQRGSITLLSEKSHIIVWHDSR